MTNKLLTFYANYNKNFNETHLIDFTAGYDYGCGNLPHLSTTPIIA